MGLKLGMCQEAYFRLQKIMQHAKSLVKNETSRQYVEFEGKEELNVKSTKETIHENSTYHLLV